MYNETTKINVIRLKNLLHQISTVRVDSAKGFPAIKSAQLSFINLLKPNDAFMRQ